MDTQGEAERYIAGGTIMRKSSAYYSLIFLLAFGLIAYPASAQMMNPQASERGISQSTDPGFSKGYEKGYQEGFNAGFDKGRAEALDRTDGSAEVRGFRGSDETPKRGAPDTSGGRWYVPGVDSDVDQGGPD